MTDSSPVSALVAALRQLITDAAVLAHLVRNSKQNVGTLLKHSANVVLVQTDRLQAADRLASLSDHQAAVEVRAQAEICGCIASGGTQTCRQQYGVGSWCSACVAHGVLDETERLRGAIRYAEDNGESVRLARENAKLLRDLVGRLQGLTAPQVEQAADRLASLSDAADATEAVKAWKATADRFRQSCRELREQPYPHPPSSRHDRSWMDALRARADEVQREMTRYCAGLDRWDAMPVVVEGWLRVLELLNAETVADRLASLSETPKETQDQIPDTRGVSVPGSEHGDLPRQPSEVITAHPYGWGPNDDLARCVYHPRAPHEFICTECQQAEPEEIADMESEHARQSRDAYDAGVRDGHEQGFEEGKRWEP